MIFLFFLTLINLINCYEFTNSKFNSIIYNKHITNKIDEIIYDDNKIKFLNNPNQNLCLDCFKNYCLNEKINYSIMNYSNLISDINNININNKEIILVEDFMINYGRILTLKEIEALNNYNKYSNIIFHVNDYNNLVLKNDEFIKKYKMYNFPYISKYCINNFIYNLIEYYRYDNYLQLINWNKYNIEKLDFYKIEDLLYKLHMFIIFNRENKDYLFKMIENELNFLNKKYYD